MRRSAVDRLIYALAGGVGKGRMCADTTIRPSYRWSTFTLLSAEHSLEETVRRAGGSWQTGMAVRIPDVDVTPVNAAVEADTLAAIGGIDRHFGHAGPAFVRALIADGVHREPERLREQVLAAARRLAGDTASAALCAGDTVRRAAYRRRAGASDWDPTGHRGRQRRGRWAWERCPLSNDAWRWTRRNRRSASCNSGCSSAGTSRSRTSPVDRASIGEGRWHRTTARPWHGTTRTRCSCPTGRLGVACGGALKPEALARVLDERRL